MNVTFKAPTNAPEEAGTTQKVATTTSKTTKRTSTTTLLNPIGNNL
jgi:hypothetical protein